MADLATDVPWPDTVAGRSARAAADPHLGALLGVIEWVTATAATIARPRLAVIGAAPAVVAAQAADADCSITEHSPAGYDDGARAADTAIDEGIDLLLLAVPAAGDASAAVLASVFTGAEPVKVLPRGAAAVDADAWMARAIAVRDARHHLYGLRGDPGVLLGALGDDAVATAAGLALRAASRHTPVVLDGAGAIAAALVVFEAQPRAVHWWAAADAGDDPAQEQIITRLGLRTLLGLGTDVADGTAALLALGVLREAVRRAGPGGADAA